MVRIIRDNSATPKIIGTVGDLDKKAEYIDNNHPEFLAFQLEKYKEKIKDRLKLNFQFAIENSIIENNNQTFITRENILKQIMFSVVSEESIWCASYKTETRFWLTVLEGKKILSEYTKLYDSLDLQLANLTEDLKERKTKDGVNLFDLKIKARYIWIGMNKNKQKFQIEIDKINGRFYGKNP